MFAAVALSPLKRNDRIELRLAVLRTLLPISGYHRFVDHKYLAPLRSHFMAIANKIEAARPGTLRHR
jgi:hypothetical protein